METYVSIEKKANGYALLTICREPVNSMNLELWQQLLAALDSLEADRSVRGVIFQSGLKKEVFTAGNDLFELYAPKTNAARYRDFWVTQNTFFSRLYSSPLVTIAAIRGACPAGGCALALCCDYRVMTEAGSIGLNEVAIGIPVPAFWAQLMLRTVGQRRAEMLLPFGLMPQAAEALRIGLVDELVPTSELGARAEAAMNERLLAPDAARQATKRHLRAAFAAEWLAFCEPEAVGGWELVSHPRTVQALEGVLARLSKGAK